jgi:iron complex transport system permease protein
VSGPPAPGRPRLGRSQALLWALVFGFVGIVLLSPLIGNVAIPPGTVLGILANRLTGGAVAVPCAGSSHGPLCGAYVQIVWEARVPEILLALGVGAALGLSGGALQGVFRNPLADPFLLGISSGGTLGTALIVVYQVGLGEQNLLVPAAAFAGAMATGAVILLAARSRAGSVETLLLTGVALSSFLSAVLSLTLLANPTGSLQVDFWLLGSVGAANWTDDGIVLGGILVFGSLLALYGRELNLVQLGPEVAQSLGVDARALRIRLLFLTAMLTAVAVAFTGIIGFVGLVSPHVVRRVAGTDYRRVLPGSALVGAGFLLASRDLSLLLFPASLLPIGIFTSFAGAPFFAYLLYRRRQLSSLGAG